MIEEFEFKLFSETDRVHRYEILEGDKLLSYQKVISFWRTSPRFREFFNDLLARSEFAAYRWETPAITPSTLERKFEFVLLDCPQLNRKADLKSFHQHFGEEGEVVAFGNLRGDAWLVVPSPIGEASDYVHLASFIRGAPKHQLDLIWCKVAECLEERLKEKSREPVWLSTAGMGWHFFMSDSIRGPSIMVTLLIASSESLS